jgi:hypothetical protein
MFEWLTGKKTRSEMPGYSRLRAVPTRPLPPDLAQEEAGESFLAKREAVERSIGEPGRRPREDTPLFTGLIPADGRHVISITLPDGGGHCLPVFTTPFRAADYRQTLLATVPGVRYLSSTAPQLLGMIRDVEGVGIQSFTLDRCPRCSIITTIGSSSVKSADDLLVLWTIHKATELARLDLYLDYAMASARAGQLETARDVALETVGHVNPEDPRAHLLLGELGVSLGDRTLLREAQECLRFFNHGPWNRRLDQVVQSGQPNYHDLC